MKKLVKKSKNELTSLYAYGCGCGACDGYCSQPRCSGSNDSFDLYRGQTADVRRLEGRSQDYSIYR